MSARVASPSDQGWLDLVDSPYYVLVLDRNVEHPIEDLQYPVLLRLESVGTD